MENTQLSAGNSSHCPSSNNRVTPPPPLTLSRRPTPDKRVHHGLKKNAIENKLLQIIEKLEKTPDEDECFCLSLATTLRKIHDPQKNEYTKLQL